MRPGFRARIGTATAIQFIIELLKVSVVKTVRLWPPPSKAATHQPPREGDQAEVTITGQGARAAATCAVSSELRTKHTFPSRNFQ
jgi:hypothetical protein